MDMHVLTSLAKQNLPPQYVPLWHANCFQLKQSRPKDSGRTFDLHPNCLAGAYLVAQTVKNLPTMQETQVRSGSGRSPGEGNGTCYPLQYSCLENSMDRGAWWAAVQRVAKSWT